MHLLPTEDQRALREAVRDLCAGIDLAREDHLVDPALWGRLAEMGVFTLRVPEADGGVGLGLTDAVLVFEELGRSAVPGPLVATHLAGSATRRVGLVERPAEPGPLLVEHLADLDDLWVLDGDRLSRVDPGALDATPTARPLDPWTPVHRVAALPPGEPVGADVRRLRLEGALLTAALQAGIAAAALSRSVRYVSEREQFGRPVGSFQAVKHAAADMLVRLELARAAVHAAAATPGLPPRAVSAAKLLADEAATRNCLAAVQLHGGMGFAWEVEVHYFLKRAWVHDVSWGDADAHAEQIAAAL
ncbi:acyl-CoA dehydrogenase family protein [Dactylosporangium sp. CA-092794]|uniref:acyl-CoA dehydrogenase family protein n=1 Tax=Dactylosporangium sp. CA-092794 TaxID=3239929 RepID=UPI003D8C6834